MRGLARLGSPLLSIFMYNNDYGYFHENLFELGRPLTKAATILGIKTTTIMISMGKDDLPGVLVPDVLY